MIVERRWRWSLLSTERFSAWSQGPHIYWLYGHKGADVVTHLVIRLNKYS